MTFTVVIPARYDSTRLPGKPLEDLLGKTMIQRVWERASSSRAGQVIVATDDERIQHCVEGFGGTAMLTSASHSSGTDRLAEVAERLGLDDESIVVNVQGDEPLIPASVIDQVADNLAHFTQASIATVCESITSTDMLADPNAVKVVFDQQGYALYFSRAPIPWHRDRRELAGATLGDGQCWRHLGIYAYRAGLLRRFAQWEPAPLEQIEALEQLRAMHHGERIHVAPATAPVPGGVDTVEDLERLRRYLATSGDA